MLISFWIIAKFSYFMYKTRYLGSLDIIKSKIIKNTRIKFKFY